MILNTEFLVECVIVIDNKKIYKNIVDNENEIRQTVLISSVHTKVSNHLHNTRASKKNKEKYSQ